MSNLYSILGFFGGCPFEGYFKKQGLTQINGVITDFFGDSELAGEWNKNSLKFVKFPFDNSFEIKMPYEYQLKNGIWVGKYIVDGFSGDTICSIGQIPESFNFNTKAN